MSKINYNEIDEEMRPIIKELNGKGWETMFCCQGHWYNEKNSISGGYLLFKKEIEDKYLIRLKCMIEKPTDKPQSKIRVGNYHWEGNRTLYWYGNNYKRVTREEKENENKKVLAEILEWAKELPRYKNR